MKATIEFSKTTDYYSMTNHTKRRLHFSTNGKDYIYNFYLECYEFLFKKKKSNFIRAYGKKNISFY